MYAIVNKGNGRHYTSMVFGHYEDKKKDKNQSEWGQYYIVLNEEKTALVKHYAFDQNVHRYIRPMTVITDCDQKNWNVDERNGFGEINTFTKERLLYMVEMETVSDELLEMDKSYKFVEYPEIHNQEDIDNLMYATGFFHDAFIEKQEQNGDSLYVLFDGVWGAKIEMWFSGDLEFDTKSRDPRYESPYWFGSTMVLKNGFIYFIDDEDREIEDIGEGFCWFKARYVKYHIIPR